MPSVVHCTDQYANNRAEVWHRATRQRERHMRRFKSMAHLQRFASINASVQNLFRVGRTCCGPRITACFARGYSPNGTRWRVLPNREEDPRLSE
jgi:transposase-like protein